MKLRILGRLAPAVLICVGRGRDPSGPMLDRRTLVNSLVTMLYDVFICHASEDKDTIVRALADALRAKHIEVWYDEFSLTLGDSIRRAIDHGLTQSRFGVVVLSKAFFAKQWPQYELDGLADREMSAGQKVILPVWHGVTHADVAAYSPSLAGRRAVSTHVTDNVVAEIEAVVHPAGSPLVIARDLVVEWGGSPPVVTDVRWLEAVEASNRAPSSGMSVPPHAIWGRWSFPLPPPSVQPVEWGSRLAWSYMQLDWVKAAEDEQITPLTRPEIVHDFIRRFPGLHATCEDFPDHLVEYAPQFTIRGFDGDLKKSLERGYRRSCATARRWERTPRLACEPEWALRHRTLGGNHPATVARAYFSGGMFGPPVSPYEDADHLFWLFSESSTWLPAKVRAILTDGLATHGAWQWDKIGLPDRGDWTDCGVLRNSIRAATDKGKAFRWSPAAINDLRVRADKTRATLKLPERAEFFVDR